MVFQPQRYISKFLAKLMQRSECLTCNKCCATKCYAANLRIKAPMTRKGGKRLLFLPFYRSNRKQQATFKKLQPVLVHLELILIYHFFKYYSIFKSPLLYPGSFNIPCKETCLKRSGDITKKTAGWRIFSSVC